MWLLGQILQLALLLAGVAIVAWLSLMALRIVGNVLSFPLRTFRRKPPRYSDGPPVPPVPGARANWEANQAIEEAPEQNRKREEEWKWIERLP